MKLWDYLYAGPPIVGSGYIALRDYQAPLVRFAEGADDFVTAVREAIANPEEGRHARRTLALENTWDARAVRLHELLREPRRDRQSRRDASADTRTSR